MLDDPLVSREALTMKKLEGACLRVKIFEYQSAPNALEAQINAWLDSGDAVGIVAFIPIAHTVARGFPEQMGIVIGGVPDSQKTYSSSPMAYELSNVAVLYWKKM